MNNELIAGPTDCEGLRRLVEESRKAEQEARQALCLLVQMINVMPVGLTVHSEEGKTLLSNRMASSYNSQDGESAIELTLINEATNVEKHSVETDRQLVTTKEDSVISADGERTLLRFIRSARILDQNLILSAAIDVTAQKNAEIELSRRAYFDDLTGLPNRRLIEEEVETLLKNGEAFPRFGLAFIDIDNFKHINDYYTHAVGDALLIKVARRIAKHVRPSDVLGRISGDEFLLILNPLDDDAALAEIVSNLLQQLKEPFLIEGFEIFTSASIGLSIYPDHGHSYELLRRAADTAMYRIKEGAKGGAILFNPGMGRAMTARMAQEQRLRVAVRDGYFCCAFQPKVDIYTHQVVGAEALIRLRDENGYMQAPGEFIGLASELGLIDDLTFLALRQIVDLMTSIDEVFGPELSVSINIAAKQAGNLSFMRSFCEELGRTGFAPRFMIEVTEDALVATKVFQAEVLPMICEVGARLSIDDFGTGYSSLATLADITADEIKIDQSFIRDIHNRPRHQSVLRAIEALTEPLGMSVIAEGVETSDEVAFLQAATQIRFAQGFYFCRPLFIDEITGVRRTARHSRGSKMSRDRLVSRSGS